MKENHAVNASVFAHLNNGKDTGLFRTKVKHFSCRVPSSGFSIKLLVKGAEYYSIDDHQFEIKKGQFLIVDKGHELSCNIDANEFVQSICIYLDKALYDDIIAYGKKDDFLEATPPQGNNVLSNKYYLENCRLSNLLTQIMDGSSYANPGEEFFIELTECLALHQIEQMKMTWRIKAINSATRSEIMNRLRVAKAYIYDNYDEHLTLDVISEVACISKYHLLRCFKNAYQLTPHQMLNQRRIEKSKQLLKTGQPITEVALNCGFNDHRSFGRVFKKSVGKSPSDFQMSI